MTDREAGTGLKDRLKARVHTIRQRSPLVDQAMRTYQHYSNVQANLLAGATTYFGYLSFFPVLALGFAVTGYITTVVPGAKTALIEAVESIFPGLVGRVGSDALLDVTMFEQAVGAATVIGLVGLLYSGLGWLSALRESLQAVFAVPPGAARNFALGKAFDLVTLVVLGLVLMVSVGLSAIASSFFDALLDEMGLEDTGLARLALRALAIALGVLASTVLFIAMFRILPKPDLPLRAVVEGALVGALLFEVLKLLATTIIGRMTGSPAFAVVGVSLVLVVWINYFSRVTLLAASWAAMTPPGRKVVARREVEEVERLVAGEPVLPAAVGAFRPASTPEGGAAPWPTERARIAVDADPPTVWSDGAESSGRTRVILGRLGLLAAGIGLGAAIARRRSRQ